MQKRLIPEEREVKDYLDLKLKKDYKCKAIYCGKDGHIFLETFTKYYKEISDFLIAIGEPLHRTKNIHEFVLTTYSLYAAASMNIKTQDIITILSNLSKNELPLELINHIKQNTETYGKVRLVLKNKRYFIYCNDKDILKKVQMLDKITLSHNKVLERNKSLKKNQNIIQIKNDNILSVRLNSLTDTIHAIMEEDKEKEENDEMPPSGDDYFEVDSKNIEEVKKVCIDNKFPLLEEYDFKNDNLPILDIIPKFKKPTRGYQEKALGLMFSNNRARSGIIVLPCGAGKTLVGILATCTIKKNTIILCNSSVSVDQWYREIQYWSKIKNVAIMTSKKKEPLWKFEEEGGILIASYTMIGYKGNRSAKTQADIDKIKDTEWGLMILDEVQVLPAKMFRTIVSIIKSHCKLGLTATLVREDEKIKDLNFLIGPKHYEANWLDLQRDGYLARVKCMEVWCEMSPEFYEEYLKSDSSKRIKLYVSNPIKFFICKALIEKHKKEKIIIFSDDLFTLKNYAEELRYPCIYGKVSENDRNRILQSFRDENSGENCLLMSKVGDTSIDLPNAKVIIQISSHFGSRRQEAQRLGRILRPKTDLISEYNAFFYTIISKNTEEMFFANKRHRFLVDQGYYFKVVTDLKKDLGIEGYTVDEEYSSKILGKIKDQRPQEEEEEEEIDNDYVGEDEDNKN